MNYQQHLANSAAIRAEIQRFESVHPNIYSIYELLERVDEPLLQNQIREHVIAIEAFLRFESKSVQDFLYLLVSYKTFCQPLGLTDGKSRLKTDTGHAS
ncbi:arf-GAP with GTPase, ANK repeat and PH domain-containing protein 1 isoform X4 [Tachysurus ichikawai]